MEDLPFWALVAGGLVVVAFNVGGAGRPWDWLDSPRQAIEKEYGYEDISINYQPAVLQFKKNIEDGNFVVDPRRNKMMQNLNAAGDAMSPQARKMASINNSVQNYRWGSGNLGGTAVRPFIYGDPSR